MGALRHLSPFQARLLLALFACAMLARAIVPAGWMPVAGVDGFRIVLCSGAGPMPVARPHHAMVGMHHGEEAGHDNPGADHPCAFAGVTPAIDAPTLVLPLPLPFLRVGSGLIRLLVAIGHGLAAPPPPQTGPPAFA